MGNSVEMHVGSRLRRTREFRGIQQRDLARSLGLDVDGLDRLERGGARLAGPVLFAAGKALRVDPNFFFQGLKGLDCARTILGLDGIEPSPSHVNDNLPEFRKPPARGWRS